MIDETIHEPWRSFLGQLDKIVEEETQLHCLGGFVVTQFYGADRKTLDIDVLSIVPKNASLIDKAGKGSPLHKEHGYLPGQGRRSDSTRKLRRPFDRNIRREI